MHGLLRTHQLYLRPVSTGYDLVSVHIHNFKNEFGK